MARQTPAEHLYTVPEDDESDAITEAVYDFATRIKKITVTDDGKLAVQLESVGLNGDNLDKVQRLLGIMQGTVLISFQPAQRELFE